jgi:hypothetical protein
MIKSTTSAGMKIDFTISENLRGNTLCEMAAIQLIKAGLILGIDFVVERLCSTCTMIFVKLSVLGINKGKYDVHYIHDTNTLTMLQDIN